MFSSSHIKKLKKRVKLILIIHLIYFQHFTIYNSQYKKN